MLFETGTAAEQSQAVPSAAAAGSAATLRPGAPVICTGPWRPLYRATLMAYTHRGRAIVRDEHGADIEVDVRDRE